MKGASEYAIFEDVKYKSFVILENKTFCKNDKYIFMLLYNNY